jgi:molybdopterin/thiamine biosynthesis adenylyltransferase
MAHSHCGDHGETSPNSMNDNQLLRYSRHILLDQLGVEAQEVFLRSHALIIGAGGLGSPVALYLASAGVGKLTICDGDVVDLTNLQRQIVHRETSIDVNKSESAKQTLAAVNSDIKVVAVSHRVAGAELEALVANADVVLDCSDNFATRHELNRACVRQRKPLVSGAGIRFDGQVAVFDLSGLDSPCYHCLFPENSDQEEVRCAVMGVFAPLVGIIGAMQAAEALKVLARVGQSLNGRLLLLDTLAMEWHSVRLQRDPQCAVCSVRSQASGVRNQSAAVPT